VLERLRRWDARSADGVDVFVANSAHVAQRVRRAYGRNAEVLYPPVDVAGFPLHENKDTFYLTVSRLEAYKRIDLLVEAFARMPDRRLMVIGDGPERRRLCAAAPSNVAFLGRLPTPDVRDHMQRARAFLFAGIEDFGIVMAEAQACGTPLVAFGGGGAAEIARADTAVLFREQTAEAVVAAVRRFEGRRFSPQACRENALRFDRAGFRQRFNQLLRAQWDRFSRRVL
jgi:glycosyltransferase involved in cell wall biosynthesis